MIQQLNSSDKLASVIMPPTALKYEVRVQESGRVDFSVPFSPGSRLTIFVVGEFSDQFDDLMNASQSSLDFWDNPFDDEDWNDA